MMSASARHDALVREIVRKIGLKTNSSTELMVVIESTLTAAMLLNARLYGAAPHVAAGLVEAAVQRAIVRFSGGNNKNG